MSQARKRIVEESDAVRRAIQELSRTDRFEDAYAQLKWRMENDCDGLKEVVNLGSGAFEYKQEGNITAKTPSITVVFMRNSRRVRILEVMCAPPSETAIYDPLSISDSE